MNGISDGRRALIATLVELFGDQEFALRLRVFEGRSIHTPLVQYLTRRGVSAMDAEILCMAYLAGSTHAFESIQPRLEQFEAMVNRLQPR